jgi:hypothetical protein
MDEAIAYNKREINYDDLIITPEQLKKFYLFGVDMSDDDGNPYDPEMFVWYIKSAQQWLESQIPGLKLTPTTIADERHDYYINDYVAYSYIKLFNTPVQSVQSVEVQFPLATQVLKFDPSWYRVESVGATVQLVPTQGTFSSILLSQGGSFLPLFYSGMQNVPAIFKISYKCGFEAGKVPMNIVDIIGLKAGIQPLNIAGDLIAGAGVASKSISLDGLSQSLNTTASAENTGYSANIKQREKEIESRLKDLKNYYCGISMTVA